MAIIKMIKRITGLTQDSLANFLGVSRASVSSWENGIEMSAYQKRIISEKFMIPMKYLECDLTNNFEMCREIYNIIDNNWDYINNRNTSKIDQMLNQIEYGSKLDTSSIKLSDYEIIEALSEGADPYTGMVFEKDHILNDNQIKEFLNRLKNKYFKFGIENKTYNDLNDNEQKLFDELKSWRREMTYKEGFFSAYMVFTDRELINIITANIKKKEDLLRVKGIADIKYNKYGDDIYRILNQHREKYYNNFNEKTILVDHENMVKVGKSVKIKNINTMKIEIFNIVNLEYHYEPRFGNSRSIYAFDHYKTVKVYDRNLDIDNNEISTDSEFFHLIEGATVGYKFKYKDDVYEIMEITDYKKNNN